MKEIKTIEEYNELTEEEQLKAIENSLEKFVKLGILKKIGNDKYTMTEKGKMVAESIIMVENGFI